MSRRRVVIVGAGTGAGSYNRRLALDLETQGLDVQIVADQRAGPQLTNLLALSKMLRPNSFRDEDNTHWQKFSGAYGTKRKKR